jgi:hypothetical protein
MAFKMGGYSPFTQRDVKNNKKKDVSIEEKPDLKSMSTNALEKKVFALANPNNTEGKAIIKELRSRDANWGMNMNADEID